MHPLFSSLETLSVIVERYWPACQRQSLPSSTDLFDYIHWELLVHSTSVKQPPVDRHVHQTPSQTWMFWSKTSLFIWYWPRRGEKPNNVEPRVRQKQRSTSFDSKQTLVEIALNKFSQARHSEESRKEISFPCFFFFLLKKTTVRTKIVPSRSNTELASICVGVPSNAAIRRDLPENHFAGLHRTANVTTCPFCCSIKFSSLLINWIYEMLRRHICESTRNEEQYDRNCQ